MVLVGPVDHTDSLLQNSCWIGHPELHTRLTLWWGCSLNGTSTDTIMQWSTITILIWVSTDLCTIRCSLRWLGVNISNFFGLGGFRCGFRWMITLIPMKTCEMITLAYLACFSVAAILHLMLGTLSASHTNTLSEEEVLSVSE